MALSLLPDIVEHCRVCATTLTLVDRRKCRYCGHRFCNDCFAAHNPECDPDFLTVLALEMERSIAAQQE